MVWQAKLLYRRGLCFHIVIVNLYLSAASFYMDRVDEPSLSGGHYVLRVEPSWYAGSFGRNTARLGLAH